MNPPLPIDGVLPPDLQGTLVRVGPGAEAAGALHAIELRDGTAVSYRSSPSAADANVFWHAGSVLALAEIGPAAAVLPRARARGVRRRPHPARSPPTSTGTRRRWPGAVRGRGRHGAVAAGPAHRGMGRSGRADAVQGVALERATWQHDIGVTAANRLHGVPDRVRPTGIGATGRRRGASGRSPSAGRRGPRAGSAWWIAAGDGSRRALDPPGPLPGHPRAARPRRRVEGAHRALRRPLRGARERTAFDLDVVGGRCRRHRGEPDRRRARRARALAHRGDGLRAGPGRRPVRGVPPVGPAAARALPSATATASSWRPGWTSSPEGTGRRRGVDQLGLLQFDVARDEVRDVAPGRVSSGERAAVRPGGRREADDEGWLLTVVHDAARGASDLYVLDASSFGPGGAPGRDPPAGGPALPQPRDLGRGRALPLNVSVSLALLRCSRGVPSAPSMERHTLPSQWLHAKRNTQGRTPAGHRVAPAPNHWWPACPNTTRPSRPINVACWPRWPSSTGARPGASTAPPPWWPGWSSVAPSPPRRPGNG